MITKRFPITPKTGYRLLDKMNQLHADMAAQVLEFILLKNDGAPARWISYQSGLSDDELEAAIAFEFGAYQEKNYITGWHGEICFQFMGKNWAPLVIRTVEDSQAILFGKPLLQAVRQLLEIPNTQPGHSDSEAPSVQLELVFEKIGSLA